MLVIGNRNGFRLLKPGGTMIYSTCSLTQAQNEQVVQWLLNCEPEAKLVPIDNTEKWIDPITRKQVWQAGTLPHTVRFHPLHSRTSGLFIAKIVRSIVCKR